MKNLLLIITPVFLIQVCSGQTSSFDYFGQIPPGNTPIIFAPEIISTGGSKEGALAISLRGDEIFFSRGNGWPYTKIMHMVKSGDTWSSPDTAIFSKDCWATQPSFSPDGQYVYFSTSKGKSDIRYYSLWRMKKNGDGWSEPESVIDMGGGEMMEFDPIATNDGVYFLYWNYASQVGDIYMSKNIAGVATAPINAGYPINTQYNEVAPHVDPDETYMIFLSNRPGGYGNADSYISFKKNDGTWTNPKNVGPKFNTPNYDNFMHVSTDGKYLFLEMNDDMYWVQAGNLIDSLKHTNFIPYLKSQIPDQRDTAGHPFNYQIPDGTFLDDDGNTTLRYTAKLSNGLPLPSWLLFDSTTRTFSGTPVTAATPTIKVTAADTANASISCQFKITVVAGPNGIENKDQLPKESQLLQNYPNPFNPTTTIQYSLNKPSQVKLTIYDLLGQKVRTLQNSFQNAGEYSLIWDTTDEMGMSVSSGIYIYRLESNDHICQKKMVLTR
jgi:hypothetical protein